MVTLMLFIAIYVGLSAIGVVSQQNKGVEGTLEFKIFWVGVAVFFVIGFLYKKLINLILPFALLTHGDPAVTSNDDLVRTRNNEIKSPIAKIIYYTGIVIILGFLLLIISAFIFK